MTSQKRLRLSFIMFFQKHKIHVRNNQIIDDFLNPDFILIGQLDTRSGNELENFYNTIYKKKMNYKRMTIESAEITKLSVNTYITNKISYANMISEISQRIPNTNIDDTREKNAIE